MSFSNSNIFAHMFGSYILVTVGIFFVINIYETNLPISVQSQFCGYHHKVIKRPLSPTSLSLSFFHADKDILSVDEDLDYDTLVRETLKQFKLNFENHSAGKKLYMQFLQNRK